MGMRPGWVGGLVEESFFVECAAHEDRKKNEKNIFCLSCCASICPHCAPAHRRHPLIQVRRYVYNDVVRLDDLERLIDCSFVQPYTINSAKVIFLKPRPQSRPFKGSGNVCLTCDRILQEPFHFCCLSCKVDHVMTQGGDLSNILYVPGGPPDLGCGFPRFENLRVDGFDDDAGQYDQVITPNSILEDPLQRSNGGSASGGSSNGSGRNAWRVNGDDVPRKKKSGGGGGFFPQIVLSLGNRRKGAPHRAPLA
ncbi:protein RGF1 INDUCIBLE TRANSCRIPTION FACTOR 1-like [Phragmites australis]|uniref:protein RGF1 INDUCIBLE TRANSCRIPTION FACTOR 1-like n=1 Tax=Phragmites australis TaxID=29695 RepID=UPI002D778060|nr:protein RGF1 INDUCIBLE TRANSCRIPTION FACTOR 1-like [Phragmites australis]